MYVPSDKSPRHSLDGDEVPSGERGVEHSPAHSSEANTPVVTTPSTPGSQHTPDDPPYFLETWLANAIRVISLMLYS